MLYDGAIRFLQQAAAAMREGRHAQSRDRLHRAQAVIEELNRSLDLRQGEVALRAGLHLPLLHPPPERRRRRQSDPAGYEKVADLLAGLRESWAEIETSTERQTA